MKWELSSKNHNLKIYLSGLLGVLVVFSVVLGFYCNSATQLNDGWLEIYSNSLLNGGHLYKDINFPLLPFPVFLFTFISKIFGESLIVGHIVGAILKLIILGLFYSILFKFFGGRNAFLGTLVTGAVLISIIYDCCLFSYNDLMYAFGLGVTLILLNLTSNLSENKSTHFYSLALGLLLGLMLISKQTHGIVISAASIVLQIMAVLKYKNLKEAVKSTLITICPIILIISGLVFYLFQTNSLNDFYVNVIGGVSSKGDVGSLIFHHFKVLADSSIIWVVYIGVCIFIAAISATKNINQIFKFHRNHYDNIFTILTGFVITILTIFIAYYCVKNIGSDIFNFKFLMSTDKVFKQVCSIGFDFTDIFVFYLFFDYVFSKEYSNAKFQYFILSAMIFSLNYSSMLSQSMTNLTFFSIGFLTAWLLQQETPLYKIKNAIIYIIASVLLFMSVCSKIICPAYWHNWTASNLTEAKKDIPNVTFLKGMKLPAKEADFFSEIKAISDKYTAKDDKIYCFINNQLFYRLLDRKPFTKNVNLYFDLCSDEKAIADMEELINNPPKLIIWLKMPYSIIDLHERLFRNSNFSGQRHINSALEDMVRNKKFKTVKLYRNEFDNFFNKYEKFVANPNDKKKLTTLNKEIKKEMKFLKKKHSYKEEFIRQQKIKDLILQKNEIAMRYKQELDIENYRYFLPNDYELYVLVRSDIYKKENHNLKNLKE